MEQRSDEWYAARCGSLGASQLHMAIAKIKSGWGASRANIMAQIIAERMTGVPQEGYINAAMQHGIDTEPMAREAYQIANWCEVEQVAIVYHPTIKGTHCSPDGLVGDDGMVEFKCPNTATHIDTLLSKSFDGKYLAQCQWQMACTGRKWVDLVSFDPRMPADLQMFVLRIHRDDERIAELEAIVSEFLAEVDDKIARLQEIRLEAAA